MIHGSFDIQFAHILKELITNGTTVTDDRTGVGTKKLFSRSITTDVSDNKVPLLRLRKIGPRIGYRECQWMISGDTDVKTLTDDDIHIWDGNSSKEFLEASSKSFITPGTIGKGYGHQFRNFNGVDQFQNVIDGVKNNPNGRRHVISLWNVSDLDEMALPPCHYIYEFFVDGDKLNLWQHMRSADMILGVPTNAIFATTLLKFVAAYAGLKPNLVKTDMTDCHIYLNHIDVAKQMLGKVGELNKLVTPRMDFGELNINSIDDMVNHKWDKSFVTDYEPILNFGRDDIPMAV